MQEFPHTVIISHSRKAPRQLSAALMLQLFRSTDPEQRVSLQYPSVVDTNDPDMFERIGIPYTPIPKLGYTSGSPVRVFRRDARAVKELIHAASTRDA